MTRHSIARNLNQPRWLLAVAASVLAVSVAATAKVPSGQATKPTPANPPASQTSNAQASVAQSDEELAKAGEALVNKVCSTSCHGLEKLDEMRRTSRDWNEQVGAMAVRGAEATDAQFATIKKYVTRYYGLVAVNTATAEEFSAVLGFSAKDAQAIVAYRTAHGKFADAEALSKVPGIDKTKIDEQPDALIFK